MDRILLVLISVMLVYAASSFGLFWLFSDITVWHWASAPAMIVKTIFPAIMAAGVAIAIASGKDGK